MRSLPQYTVRAANQNRLNAELKTVPTHDLRRVRSAIDDLAASPRPAGVVQIRRNTYRLRRGNWRIIYRIYDPERLILIGAIRRRNERTYAEVERLFPGEQP